MSLRLINAGSDLVVFDTNPDASGASEKRRRGGGRSSPKEVFDSVDLALSKSPDA